MCYSFCNARKSYQSDNKDHIPEHSKSSGFSELLKELSLIVTFEISVSKTDRAVVRCATNRVRDIEDIEDIDGIDDRTSSWQYAGYGLQSSKIGQSVGRSSTQQRRY